MRKADAAKVQELYFGKVYDFFHKYLPKQKNCSSHTVDTYKASFKTFGEYVTEVLVISLNEFYFENVTYDLMLNFRNYMFDVKKHAESTCNVRLAVQKTYIDYCASRDISLQSVAFAVSQVPFLKIPEKRQPIIEDVDALAALLNAPTNTTDKGIRDRAMLTVLYDAALRVEELVSLSVGDVIQGTTISFLIHGKGNKERTVTLDELSTKAVNQYRNIFHPKVTDPTHPFFYTLVDDQPKQMTTRNVRAMVKKYADQIRPNCQLPASVSPHTLRRTRGTYLYRDGVPLEVVSRFLGHSSVEVTRKHYAFESKEQQLETARRQTGAIPKTDSPQTDGADVEEKLYPDDMDELMKILGM